MENSAVLTLKADLKDEIARCWNHHDGTQDDELKKTYAAIIKTARETSDKLVLLLQQREERQLLAQQQQHQTNTGRHLNHISSDNCLAKWADGSGQVCNRPSGAHLHAPSGNYCFLSHFLKIQCIVL
jgi:hypothetical protein